MQTRSMDNCIQVWFLGLGMSTEADLLFMSPRSSSQSPLEVESAKHLLLATVRSEGNMDVARKFGCET